MTSCGNIRKDAAAEEVISTVGPIDSLSVVFGVVELLAINSIYCLVDGVGFIEGNMVGVVVEGRRDRYDCADEHKEEQIKLHDE